MISRNDDKEIYEIKIVLLGESGVGKTCLFERYVCGTYNECSEATKNAVYDDKTFNSPDNKTEVNLRIWDTAGQEVYHSLTSYYYKDADVAMFIYDVTNSKSFSELQYWISQVKENNPKKCVLSIVGNKSDMIDKEVVDTKEAMEFATKNNANHFVVSAKEDINVNSAFEDSVIQLYPQLKTLLKKDVESENQYDEDIHIDSKVEAKNVRKAEDEKKDRVDRKSVV